MKKAQLTKEREAREKKEMVDKIKKSKMVLFIKRLVGTLFGLAIFCLGLYAIYVGLHSVPEIKRLALTVSGTCAAINGVYVLYRVLVFGEE